MKPFSRASQQRRTRCGLLLLLILSANAWESPARAPAKAQRPKAASTHHSANTPEELHAEMRAVYAGHFVVSRDLDVY